MMVDVSVAVAGCPDLKPPSGAWVERVAERAVVRCNHSQETWFLTCDGTHWLGTLTNCSQGLYKIRHFSPLKTHYCIIFFVQPRYSKPGMGSYCSSSTEQLSWKAYGAIISQARPYC